MLRLAILSARGRLGTFTGALVALFAAAVLSMAWGMQLESILRTHAPVERYAAATAVVTGQQKVGADHDVLLGERARVSSALTARLAAVPGVRAAIGDVSVPALLGEQARGRPRLGQRRADAVRAERRTRRPPVPARSSPAIPPRSARGCRWRPPSPRARSRWSASPGPATPSPSRPRSS